MIRSGLGRLTLVTALFDLARRERNPHRTQMETYLRHAEFLFGLDEDVVFFVDEEFAREVRERRAARGHSERTLVVPSTLEERNSYSLLGEIETARRRRPVLNASPEKDTAMYIALTWSKFEVLKEAIELDRFRAGHFAWIDFGIGAVETVHHAEDAVFARPSRRIRLLTLRTFTAEEVLSPSYYDHLWGHVAAGYVPGGRAEVKRLCALVDEEAAAALAGGRAPSEEQLLPVLCAKHPDLFEFHYGDYRHVLENYVHPRCSAANLLFQLRHCHGRGDFARSYEIASGVVESHRAGRFACRPDELAALLDEAFVAAYYAEHPSQDAAREVASLFLDLVTRDPEAREFFLRHEIRIRSNFALLAPG